MAVRAQARSGSAAIEFAVIAPICLALAFVVIFLGKIYFDTETLQAAVERAGRMIAVTQNVTQSQLQTAIQSSLAPIGNPTVTVSYSTTTISGVSVGHLSATMTRSYAVPWVTTYNMTYTADTYLPPSSFSGS
ncbi:MAG TPA: TadE/TadG family type IV pilus assembly protein [Rhizomicrobium sp.]|nr:TadE/TadG family type IV pilus assembly protein [Rhizomicrobium sp.]